MKEWGDIRNARSILLSHCDPIGFLVQLDLGLLKNCRPGGNTQEQRAPVGSGRDNLDSVPIVLLLCHPCASRRCRESRSSYVIIQNRKVVWVVASRNRQGAKAMCEMKSMLTWQMLMLPLGTQDTQRIGRVPHVGAWSHTAGPLGQQQPNPLCHSPMELPTWLRRPQVTDVRGSAHTQATDVRCYLWSGYEKP